MGMRKAILAALLLAMAGCSSSPPGSSAEPVGGPSAQQLAHGRWLRIPAAPIRLCDPRAVWDGRDLVVVEGGFHPCPPGVAAYDPRANRWAGMAAPPWPIGQGPVAAWGGGRLVLVSPVTGVTVTWSPATGQWHRIATLPSQGAVSLSWTGSTFLVITIGKAATRAFALGVGRWARLPDLPRPRRGSIVEVATAADDRAVYALADINVPHNNPNDTYNSGSAELLRLTATAWTPVPLTPGAPRSQLALTQVDGHRAGTGKQRDLRHRHRHMATRPHRGWFASRSRRVLDSLRCRVPRPAHPHDG